MFGAMKIRCALFPAALLLGLGLVGCGDDRDADGAGASQTAGNGDVFNTADVEFAQDMIPHHAQAVAMVVMTQGRPVDAEVEALAASIREAQVPEVETMVGWLAAWNQEIPETSLDHANAGHDMSEMVENMEGMDADMPGMMSAEEMNTLNDASDAEFQDLWLAMMIEHHTGAIEMAEAEQRDGEFDDAVSLATSIAASQQEEVVAMTDLLD